MKVARLVRQHNDPGPLPRTSAAIVADLHAALSASGESPPYVLVGHSLGGLNMTLYTYLHREQIVGLVEVDPAVAGQDVRIAEQIPALGNQWYEMNNQTLEGVRNCADLARAGAQAAGCSLTDDPAAPAFQQAEDFFAQRASTWETLASEFDNANATQPGVQPTDTREIWAARPAACSLPLPSCRSAAFDFRSSAPAAACRGSQRPLCPYLRWIGPRFSAAARASSM